MNERGELAGDATLAVLEYDGVIEAIAGQATCEPGRLAVRALRPRADITAASAEFALVDDAAARFEAGAALAFDGVVGIDDSLDRAQRGATLAGIELVAVRRCEQRLHEAVHALRDASRHGGATGSPLLALAQTRADTQAVRVRLEGALEDDGTLADHASAELGGIRRRHRALAEEVRRRVDAIVHSRDAAKQLSEPIVTIRGGRYVVPVRAEFAAQFGGVVHDQSASGATLFVEPMSCVESNNRLRALEAAEEREVQRILIELSGLVGAAREALGKNAALVARLDAIAARARWAKAKAALAPRFVDEASLRIVRGRHPLLRREPVPLDFEIGEAFDAVVISGPNMGGKTVVLKTAGLLCAMAYAGIPLPASAGTEIGRFDRLACVIGDDQSIARDLSSFSAHLQALMAAQRSAGPRTLVLVDEIGSGTEPAAGAAFAQAWIEALLAAGARVVVTTHFTQLKTFAAATPRAMNASMLFDSATGAPTFMLAMGVPGQSHAFSLARHLGLDAHTIARAEALLGSDAQALERTFENLALERERLLARQAELDAELERLRAEERSLQARLADADAARGTFEREAELALERAVAELRESLSARAERSERDARRQRAHVVDDAGDDLKRTMADIRRSLGLGPGAREQPAPADLAAGDAVFVRSFGKPGVVSEVYARDLLVTMGAVKAVVSRD
ncbi:MAG TPA: hypothetical protein VEJ20_07790, partial [Candidatus Eremiobacteraceae bacterium]|nr:hypothetical protein [Candidatus Eremiobacteraceae bacterium]